MFRLPAILVTVAAALAAVFLSLAAYRSIPRPSATPFHNASAESPVGDSAAVAGMETSSESPAGDPDETKTPPLRLLFFGDLMLDRHVGERVAAKGLDHLLAGLVKGDAPEARLYSTSTPLLSGRFDIVTANLEGAVTDAGAHYPPANAYDFAFAPDLIGQLKPYGFNFFNLANNHLSDQGADGVVETARNLDALGIAYSGCPDTKTGDCSARNMEINGRKVAFLGFSQVYGALDREEVLRQVASSSEAADLAVVNIHWGREYEHDFLAGQQELGRALVDAGADLVIGHHPHVVQGMEVYRDRPIFYSLGNFIFDQYFSPDTQEGLGVEMAFYDDSLELVLHPLKSQSSVVGEMEGDERELFLKRFVGWSSFNDQVSMINGQLMINF